ncbi:MAG TPA: 16S rRNA (uracil(1498)-N(3))-methyltransferase [Agitococcus sp.]|nr:16S rRNA (uracil(1498)-N(3))-methyltransferase [Agitococcus sp.]HNI63570.1 16S rRNA (uracil(1498)-N(3))-methyltransferase [Agitococcus sp.]HNL80568.1 16S rRNA (uracil(1498)-N(3))-methyltransferase [Agitococcus sp.]HNN29426.1 16S rRNA (uracil(1498)-N(3))-methyltransferase [Agitococcus sp.]
MNLLLLTPQDCPQANIAHLTGRRLQHVLEVHQAKIGQKLRVGMVNGLMGEAEITHLDKQLLQLDFVLNESPPAKLPLTLLLALPRPKMLKRILQTVATMGVQRLVLMNSYRVEKSFWDSPFLQPHAIEEELILGLEQGKDTVLPQVMIEKRFKPFVEDRLPELSANSLRLVAHPIAEQSCPRDVQQAVTLAIGCEGGFIPYEVDLLAQQGFMPVELGARILRVETAVTALIARLF